MTKVAGIAVIALVAAIDNALLAGLLLPHTDHRQKLQILGTVGVLLGLCQILLAAGVDFLMHSLIFRIAAILLLAWMSIMTLTLMQPRRGKRMFRIVVRTWFYTVFGNLDNMIWLGSTLKGDRWWLIGCSLATIPLFVTVAVFLSDQIEKRQWILPLGAGMMAWAAASLTMDLPLMTAFVNQLDDAPKTTIQCLITVFILFAGYGARRLVVRSSPP